MRLIVVLMLMVAVRGQWYTNYAPGHAGMVHLFEWHWDTIAEECETFLGPNKFAGVQVSPPNENRIINGRPWWERYQPISYVIGTKSGDRAAFEDMVDRCNAVGVRIYVDAVINHMCGDGGSGTGTAGSSFDSTARDFPGVPYSKYDFNDAICQSISGDIENYGDPNQVRNCKLVSLLDLKQGDNYVREKIVDYLNDLTSMGVAGFRVDAVKHMWPGDLNAIFSSLDDLSTRKGFPFGSRPFIFQEVIDQGGEAVSASEYFHLGRVTEFKYGLELSKNKDKIQYLETLGESWGLMPDRNALVFLNNHDNQRGHGGGGEIITFEDSYNLKIFNAFMMAWPYGVPRIMSSYRFSNTDEGPPDYQRVVKDGACVGKWVCEHRWRQIKSMVGFAVTADGAPVTNWWSADNQIAFSRGNRAFLVINKADSTLDRYFNTGMPEGSYCDVISSEMVNDECTGQCVSVDSNGRASIRIQPSSDPFLAIHVDARC